MKLKEMLALILTMLLIASSCTSNDFGNETTNSSQMSNSNQSFSPAYPDLEVNNKEKNQKNYTEELPICPSETATGCRVASTTKSKSEPFAFWEKKECEGKGPVSLISPMRIEDVSIIIPMGAMIGGHVTPIDHMYFSPAVFNSPPDSYDVYADADGIIDGIGSEPMWAENKYRKYRLTIRHTCDFYSIYNLLTSLSPEIKKITGEIPPGGHFGKPIKVKKGQLIGRIGGQTLDLSVNYDEITLKGFIVPEHYRGESWKIHTVDPFDYFMEPEKTQLLDKNIRQAEPRGGKIDYDIDGRLVGNWFIENTGGYGGNNNPEGYWKTHAAFAYDPIDPSFVIFSLGNFSDIANREGLKFTTSSIPMQFGVKGNSPDPKDVSVSSGMVKYELVDYNLFLENSSQFWDRTRYASHIKAIGGTEPKGVVLVQLVSDRKLKLEIFAGKTGAEVSGFVEPILYER